MTQIATPETVLGAFDGTTVMSDGLAYRVHEEAGEFWADMPDPDVMMYVVQGGKKLDWGRIPRKRRPVVMTTGSHHYQTYWVASERYEGLLQTLPLVYLREAKRWIPRFSSFPYDFLSPEHVRRDAVGRARDTWRKNPTPRWRDPGHALRVLMRDDGTVMEERLGALVSAKDTRSVTIKE